ncbi:MAG: DUF481 domain-containing protein [Gemmatimonadaceae bacterium]
MARLVALLLLTVSVAGPSRAQSIATSPQRLAVFLDCHADCDFDLIREEVSYVDWVRERTAADIHLLITSQGAGAGGSEYTLAFLGQRSMAGRGDTLRFTTNPTTTDDEQRRQLVRTIAAGLAPFVVRSGNAALLRITAAETDEATRPRGAPADDPWKAWVFEVGLDGGLSGEAQYKSRSLNASFEARRVTEAWKLNFEFDYEYEDDRVTDQEFDNQGNVISEQTFKNLQRNWGAEQLLVKSLTNHASAGLLGNVRSNTFRNLRRALESGPAIEYNLFPYTQSTRRELVFRYAVGYAVNQYVDTTIFDRMRETLPLHVLVMNYRTQAPWGSVSFRTEHRNYLTDAAKRNTNVNGSFNVRLFRGLEVSMNGGYSWIRDQIALRKGGGDQVDVLLRRRELLTGYDYNARIGLSYTFGSIFSNVVNPRF